MSKTRLGFLCIAFLGFFPSLLSSSLITKTVAAEKKETTNVVFHWAFGAIRKTGQESRFEQIAGDARLNSGDQIKFFLKPVTGCFLYLVYHSSQDELTVLFPYRFEEENGKQQALKAYYIPEPNEWFQLDEHVGQEKFHLLASDTRLTRLEDLINQYESGDKTRKPELSQQILSEIDLLRRKNFKTKVNAERPLSIVGNIRGTKKSGNASPFDLAEHAVEISASHFYIRTYTIDHR
jgi:Domain of unknown function (DUF4384)